MPVGLSFESSEAEEEPANVLASNGFICIDFDTSPLLCWVKDTTREEKKRHHTGCTYMLVVVVPVIVVPVIGYI